MDVFDANPAVVLLCELYMNKCYQDDVEAGRCFPVVGHGEVFSSKTFRAVSARAHLRDCLGAADRSLASRGRSDLRWHRTLRSAGDIERYWRSCRGVLLGRAPTFFFHDGGDDEYVCVDGPVARRTSTVSRDTHARCVLRHVVI